MFARASLNHPSEVDVRTNSSAPAACAASSAASRAALTSCMASVSTAREPRVHGRRRGKGLRRTEPPGTRATVCPPAVSGLTAQQSSSLEQQGDVKPRVGSCRREAWRAGATRPRGQKLSPQQPQFHQPGAQAPLHPRRRLPGHPPRKRRQRLATQSPPLPWWTRARTKTLPPIAVGGRSRGRQPRPQRARLPHPSQPGANNGGTSTLAARQPRPPRGEWGHTSVWGGRLPSRAVAGPALGHHFYH